jgi:glycosyltransferase involved in cell wall biosynthesis
MRLAVGALLDELRRRHEIHYLGYRMPDQDEHASGSGLKLLSPPRKPVRGTTLLRAVAKNRPWEADRFAAGMRAALGSELQTFNPDVLHVTSWALAGLGRATTAVPSVLTSFDAWHLNVEAGAALARLFRRPLIRAEARRIRLFEAEEFAHFSRVVVVSEQDREALSALNPTLQISVISNGVDTQFFSPTHRRAAADQDRIVFTGHMGYPPNIVAANYLARQLLPRVRAARPAAHVVIVGREPAPAVVELRSLDGVRVTGEVEDIRPWLASARVFACPMLTGTGIKNKLLEAMASALPCVATPLALQGLAVESGKEVLVGESPDELAAQILRVLGDEALAVSVGRAACEYVRSQHTWTGAAQAYEQIYAEVRRTHGGSSTTSL